MSFKDKLKESNVNGWEVSKAAMGFIAGSAVSATVDGVLDMVAPKGTKPIWKAVNKVGSYIIGWVACQSVVDKIYTNVDKMRAEVEGETEVDSEDECDEMEVDDLD
jgi:hypothetical protein